MQQQRRLRVALGEYDCGWHDPEESARRAAALVADAAARGAELVVLPEMCATGFTMDAARYSVSLDSPMVRAFGDMARASSMHLIAGFATRSRSGDNEQFHNSAVLFNPAGELVAEYRKQRLFAFAKEDKTYTAGESSCVVAINGVRIAILICFDLRFPELFRSVAASADAIVVIASWPAARQLHWETLLRARAIESQAYVVGVNRSGSGGGVDYAGGSMLIEPWGETIARADAGVIAVGDIDAEQVAEARAKFPFVIPRR